MRPALVAALLLAACGPADPPPADSTPADAPAATDPGVPLDALLGDALDARALRARLAPPVRVESEPVQNRHDPALTDTLRTYVYDHVRVRFYDRSAAGLLLERVTLTGGDARTAEGVGIGSTRAEVEAAYGPPVEAVGGAPVYEVGAGPTPLRLEVRYADGAAERLTWHPYVD